MATALGSNGFVTICAAFPAGSDRGLPIRIDSRRAHKLDERQLHLMYI